MTYIIFFGLTRPKLNYLSLSNDLLCQWRGGIGGGFLFLFDGLAGESSVFIERGNREEKNLSLASFYVVSHYQLTHTHTHTHSLPPDTL